MPNVKEMNKRLAELKSQEAKLKKEKDELAAAILEARSNEAFEEEVAEYLHAKLCMHNHMDACDWHYGGRDKSTHAHGVYMTRATYAIDGLRKAGFNYREIGRMYDVKHDTAEHKHCNWDD